MPALPVLTLMSPSKSAFVIAFLVTLYWMPWSAFSVFWMLVWLAPSFFHR